MRVLTSNFRKFYQLAYSWDGAHLFATSDDGGWDDTGVDRWELSGGSKAETIGGFARARDFGVLPDGRLIVCAHRSREDEDGPFPVVLVVDPSGAEPPWEFPVTWFPLVFAVSPLGDRLLVRGHHYQGRGYQPTHRDFLLSYRLPMRQPAEEEWIAPIRKLPGGWSANVWSYQFDPSGQRVLCIEETIFIGRMALPCLLAAAGAYGSRPAMGFREFRLWRPRRLAFRHPRRYRDIDIEVFHAPTGRAVVRARSLSMSLFYPSASSFRVTLRTFAQDPERATASLTEAHIRTACVELGVRFATDAHHIWTPALTLWTFLSQCVSESKSCAAAVARALALRVGLGLRPCSEATGAYCKARAKLPVALLSRLALQLGDELEHRASADWQWKGRRVLLGDGTTLSGPDTPANQAAYPQHKGQKRGVGFPLIRLAVLPGFATGALVGAAVGRWRGKEAGEMALLRELLDRFHAGDVFVADRAYCSYWLIAALQARGVDVALRLHRSRRYDFGTGRRLGRGDHVVTWARPNRPDRMDKATYRGTPKALTIREVRSRVDRPGYRTREVIVATTLVEAATDSRTEVSELYHHRWRVELSLRDLKQTMRMDVLRGKTPDMLSREIWGHLLAYNLVRQVVGQAAGPRNCSPRQVSMAGATQMLEAFRATLSHAEGASWDRTVAALLRAVGRRRVGHRPGRIEPREVKRRPKSYQRLTRPRATRRAELRAATRNNQAGTNR